MDSHTLARILLSQPPVEISNVMHDYDAKTLIITHDQIGFDRTLITLRDDLAQYASHPLNDVSRLVAGTVRQTDCDPGDCTGA